MEYEFRVVKLHDVPQLIEEAARLINSEWPRSLEARCHSIRNSSDDLPCSFLLLEVSTDGSTVVGYSHLSKVLQRPKSVLLESVIVDKSLRGHGLGKLIMVQTEEFALRHGYKIMHLSTHDKQSFYEHLGYSISTPVSAETKVSRFLSKSQFDKTVVPVQHEKVISVLSPSDLQTGSAAAPSQSLVPPPPPLQNILQKKPVTKSTEKGGKVVVWMEKHLTCFDSLP